MPSSLIRFIVSSSILVSCALLPSHSQDISVKSSVGSHLAANQQIKDRTLTSVRDGTFQLLASPHRPLLLAFLQTVPDSAGTPSRSESVFLLSMEHQYAARGLRFAAIDASSMVLHRKAQHDDLVNASYDWQLTYPLLEDRGDKALRDFHIRTLPTIVLINDNGIIVQYWEGFTPPVLLAQGVERLLGGPLARLPAFNSHESR